MISAVSEKIKEINESLKEKKITVKELIEKNKEILKYIKAANALISQLENASKKLQNDNFLSFEKLSANNDKITVLLERIYDGQQFLHIKENENPRELKEKFEEIETKKDEIITQTALDEKEISRLKIESDSIRQSIKKIEDEQEDLSLKIKACKKKIMEKMDEQKPILENIELLNKEILTLTNKLTKIKESKK